MEPYFTLLLLVFAFLIPLAAVFFLVGFMTRCPACRKWWRVKEVARTEMGQASGTKWVARTEGSSDSGMVQRQVRVMRITYDGLFRCKACGHTFHKRFVKVKGRT